MNLKYTYPSTNKRGFGFFFEALPQQSDTRGAPLAPKMKRTNYFR